MIVDGLHQKDNPIMVSIVFNFLVHRSSRSAHQILKLLKFRLSATKPKPRALVQKLKRITVRPQVRPQDEIAWRHFPNVLKKKQKRPFLKEVDSLVLSRTYCRKGSFVYFIQPCRLASITCANASMWASSSFRHGIYVKLSPPASSKLS